MLAESGRQEGKKADSTAHNLPLWNGLPDQVNATWISQGFWPVALANSYLKQLGHGTTLTIKFKVSLDKSNNLATATVFPDRTYTIKAVELVVPTLDNVLDTGNKEVLQGGFTVSTTLKLKGKASNGQEVEIFDGSGSSAVSKGTATANATTGNWEHTITVPVGGRRLYAQSRYHPTPVNSNVRNLTVVAVIVPTLVNVLDANNFEVPEGTSTTSTTLKLKGKASNGQEVEIFDGSGSSAVSKGTATANTTTGNWEHSITVPVGGRRLYAQSLYHSTTIYSNVRLLTVIAAVAPTITSVKAGSANGPEIPNGGTTVETTVILTGAAAKGQKVDVLDGTVSKGQPVANATTGIWTLTVSGLAMSPPVHRFTAKALYGSGVTSPAWTITVIQPVLSENFDSVPAQVITTVIDLPSMTLFSVPANRPGRLQLPPYGTTPGKIENNCLYLNGPRIVIRMELKFTYVEVGFWYRAVGAGRPSISFYDDKNILITSQSIPGVNPEPSYYKYSSARGIRHIELKSAESVWITIDNLSFKR